MNPIKQHFRLKKPCANCPFLKEGAIPLSRGRLEGIISTLIEDDQSTFQCHKCSGQLIPDTTLSFFSA